MKSSISIAVTNIKNLKRTFKKVDKAAETAIKNTVSDFGRSAPGKISKAVRLRYNIGKEDIAKTYKGVKKLGKKSKFKLSGRMVEDAALKYSGRLLTPTHFGMKPTSPPPPPYNVSAEIIKGQRRDIAPGSAFLAKASKSSATVIPWQRDGSTRTPISPIKTVSVPQMVEHDEVVENWKPEVDEKIQNRLQYHINRQFKKFE